MSNQEHKDPQDPGEQAALKRAWRQASDELPPPELDARIIAAARNSVRAHRGGENAGRENTRSRNRWMQWQPLAAAATVAGLAFVLLQLMPRERDVTPSIRIEDSAPGPAMARPEMAAPPATDRVEADQTSEQPGEAKPAAPAVEQKALGQAARESVDSGAIAGAPGPAAAKMPRDASATSAADWAARIVALYESGDSAAAADMLRAFRAAEPDADTYLPESMRDWARTVQ